MRRAAQRWLFSCAACEQLFAGKISVSIASIQRLQGTKFLSFGYIVLDMNDILATFKILFDCLVVNDWHVFADGYAIAAGTRWARLYFVAFHILSVLVVMNIVIAFILEAFIMQWNVSQSVEKCVAVARGLVQGGAAALMRRPARRAGTSSRPGSSTSASSTTTSTSRCRSAASSAKRSTSRRRHAAPSPRRTSLCARSLSHARASAAAAQQPDEKQAVGMGYMAQRITTTESILRALFSSERPTQRAQT